MNNSEWSWISAESAWTGCKWRSKYAEDTVDPVDDVVISKEVGEFVVPNEGSREGTKVGDFEGLVECTDDIKVGLDSCIKRIWHSKNVYEKKMLFWETQNFIYFCVRFDVKNEFGNNCRVGFHFKPLSLDKNARKYPWTFPS